MTQKTFLLKYNGKPTLVDLRGVSYRPITKLKETINIRGFGAIPVSEPTGKHDKSKLQLWTSSANITVESSKEAVDDRIRRLRPQEAEQLDAIDKQMEELRQLRLEIIRQAWARGHVVTVKELREMAEQELEKRKAT